MLRLALEYVKKEKRNSCIIITGIAISIIMFFSLIQIGNNLMTEYKKMMRSYSSYDLYISDLEYEEMINIHNIYKSQYSMTQVIFFADNHEGNKINYVEGVEGDWQKLCMCDILEGTGNIGKYEVVVEADYANIKQKSIGDTINLELYDNDGNIIESEFTICGIVSNLPTHGIEEYIFVSMDTALEIISESDLKVEKDSFIEYFLIDENDYPEEELMEIDSELFEIYGKDIFIKSHYNDTKCNFFVENKDTFSAMSRTCYFIVGFIVLTLIIFLYYILNLELERKRTQYGTMRALGMSHGNLIRITLYQLLIYGSVSLVIGIIGGYILNKFNSKTMIYRLIGKTVDVTAINLRVICIVVMVVLTTILFVVFAYWLRIRKLYPIDYMRNNGESKIKKYKKCKNIYSELIINNHYRNKKNSIALGITIFLTAIMSVVSMNGISSIRIKQEKTIYTEFESEIVMLPNEERDYFNKEELDVLAENNNVFKQSILFDSNVYMDGTVISDCFVVIYDKNMMAKACKACGYSSDTDSIFVGDVIQSELENLTIKNGILGRNANVEIDAICENREMALWGHRITSDNVIILAENYAKQLGIFDDQWLDVFTTESIQSVNELNNMQYVETYDLGSEMKDSKRQLRGLMSLLLYLLTSIILLAVFLINSVLKQNFYQRKKEIGMLRALGVCRGKMLFVLAAEVVIVACVSIIASMMVTIPVSIYIYYILCDEIGTKLIGFVVGMPALGIAILVVALVCANKCLKTTMMEMLRGDE